MTINLIGRIDSTNANLIEEKINNEINGFSGEVLLDASKLEYISSAGLRVILRLKKANPNTRIINCNLDVYEIFDMTGFTEMMEISKAYREISIEGCEIIGEGANGIVYRTDPDTIVKVYKSPDSLDDIKNERELARKAFVMGIPTAIPYDVVKVGNLYGSVFELLNAKSFAKLIKEGADVEKLAKDSVDILKTIHSTILKEHELPYKKEELFKWIKFSKDYLDEDTYNLVNKLASEIPDTLNMLHGDYHIKNIMQQNGENLLIDMDTLSMGHPILEFQAIFSAYVGYSCVNEDNCANFLGISKEQCQGMWDNTLKYYFDGKDKQYLDDIEKKISIVSYIHIMRSTAKHRGLDDPYTKEVIAFCTDYVTKNIKTIDKLYF